MGLDFDDQYITGVCGEKESLYVLERVIDIVFNASMIEGKQKQFQAAQSSLLSHIANNAQAMFNPPMRLFPPGFPKLEDQEPDFDYLAGLVEEIREKIESVRERS